jgi:hypothetical protein
MNKIVNGLVAQWCGEATHSHSIPSSSWDDCGCHTWGLRLMRCEWVCMHVCVGVCARLNFSVGCGDRSGLDRSVRVELTNLDSIHV